MAKNTRRSKLSKSGSSPVVKPAPVEKTAQTEVDVVSLLKDSATRPVIIGGMFGGKTIDPPGTYQQSAEVYKRICWVFDCVRTIADAGASLPMKLYVKRLGKKTKSSTQRYAVVKGAMTQRDSGQWELAPDDHPFVVLMENPNPDELQYDLMESLLSYLELDGNGFWEVARAKDGTPLELWSMRPDRVSITPRADGMGVKSYEFKASYAAKGVALPSDDVIGFRYFNPLNDWRGQSTLSAAAESVVIEEYCQRYNKSFFRNNATPEGYLYTETSMAKEQADRIAQAWSQKFRGVDKASKTAVLSGGLKYQQLGVNPRDMAFLNQRRLTREEILGVFRVPPGMVGLLEYTKYDTYKLQEFAFYRLTIQPKMKKIAGALTRFANTEYATGNELLWVEYDLSEYLREDQNYKAERYLKLFGMGAVTPNQVIEEFGMGAPFPEGDEHFSAPGYVPVGTGGGGTPEDEDAMLLQRRELLLASGVGRIADHIADVYPETDKHVHEEHEERLEAIEKRLSEDEENS